MKTRSGTRDPKRRPPEGRSGGLSTPGLRSAPTPLALWALLPVNAAALVAAVYVTGSTSEPVLGSVLLAAIGTMNAALGGALAIRLRAYEVRDRQREHVRLGVDFDASVGGIAARVLDVSLGGALIAVARRESGQVPDAPRLDFTLQGVRLSFRSHVARMSEDERTTRFALSFAPDQDEMMARLGVALLSEADASRERAVYREPLQVAA